MSHMQYKQKWDVMETGARGLASAQTTSLQQPSSDSTGSVLAAPDEQDIDFAKENVRSQRIKMSLKLATQSKESELSAYRKSALMQLAFGWLPSCELPVERIERNEDE